MIYFLSTLYLLSFKMTEPHNYSEVEKFLLDQMEGESDDAHLERVKTIKEFWDQEDNNESIAA